MTSKGIEVLSAEDCHTLLRSRTLGRVGVKLADELVVLPVFYAIFEDDIVFRTAPGTKLDAAVLGTKVAFEVDDPVPGWSVLVTGHAEELRHPDEQYQARARLGHDWPAGERERIVRIRAEKVTGRRLQAASGADDPSARHEFGP
jgi:nitroimidazol reductase NimA-like FMN-containing flavoprotein (pyridoxamine 5'-phosphate oxidase superfamily)